MLVTGSRCAVDVGMLLYAVGKIVDDCGDVICTVRTRLGNGHIQALCHHVLLNTWDKNSDRQH